MERIESGCPSYGTMRFLLQLGNAPAPPAALSRPSLICAGNTNAVHAGSCRGPALTIIVLNLRFSASA